MRFATWGARSALGGFAALAALLVLSVSAAAGADGTEQQLYIVQMIQAPVATYDGGVAGIPATKPDKGKKINTKSDAVNRYVDHLESAVAPSAS